MGCAPSIFVPPAVCLTQTTPSQTETHVISAIIHIAHDTSAPWPIQIEDHNGELISVALEEGQMMFYESAKCLHGRMQQMKGKYYGSLFVHYQPVDTSIWNYSTEVRVALHCVFVFVCCWGLLERRESSGQSSNGVVSNDHETQLALSAFHHTACYFLQIPCNARPLSATLLCLRPISFLVADCDLTQDVINAVPPHWKEGVLEEHGSRWAGQVTHLCSTVES